MIVMKILQHRRYGLLEPIGNYHQHVQAIIETLNKASDKEFFQQRAMEFSLVRAVG